MATLLLDFDSTLIACESLERILAKRLRDEPQLMAQIEAITAEGMAGQLPFRQSLERRLAIAAPSLEEVHEFGRDAIRHLTPGMAELVARWREAGGQVRIVSGGLREAILPCAEALGIPFVHAVQVHWHEDGSFAELNRDDLFSESKVMGLAPLMPAMNAPIIMVGDGMTDLAVYEAGLAQKFIAFTQHARRPKLMAHAPSEAADCQALTAYLEEWI